MTSTHDDLLGPTRAPSCAHNGGYGTSASCPKCVAALAQVVPPQLAPLGPPAGDDPFAGMALADVIGFCRANGIRKLHYKGMEVEFGDNPASPTMTQPEALQKFAEAMAGAVPSDTEFLGWSAPEFPSSLEKLAEALGIQTGAGKE